jgi:hypothetical protein
MLIKIAVVIAIIANLYYASRDTDYWHPKHHLFHFSLVTFAAAFVFPMPHWLFLGLLLVAFIF